MPLFRCFSIPVHCLRAVRRHALSVGVADAQLVLSLRKILFCGTSEPLDSFTGIATGADSFRVGQGKARSARRC